MSKTIKAILTPYRLHPLHERYLARVEQLKEIPSKYRRDGGFYETTCPYCGEEGGLKGTVKVGNKKTYSGIELRRDGYTLEGVSPDRMKELVLITCEKCDAAVDPIAYLSPIQFAGMRASTQAILEGKSLSSLLNLY